MEHTAEKSDDYSDTRTSFFGIGRTKNTEEQPDMGETFTNSASLESDNNTDHTISMAFSEENPFRSALQPDCEEQRSTSALTNLQTLNCMTTMQQRLDMWRHITCSFQEGRLTHLILGNLKQKIPMILRYINCYIQNRNLISVIYVNIVLILKNISGCTN